SLRLPLLRSLLTVCGVLTGTILSTPGAGADRKVDLAAVEFNREIRPILSDRCFTFHGPDKAKRTTGLRLDIEESARADLGGGKFAIVPGDAARSELVQRITSDDEALRMPPAYAGHAKLSDREINLIRLWIDQGAKWQKHWSFIPPQHPQPPLVKNQGWPRN